MQFAKRHMLKATLVVVLLLVFVVPSFANVTNGGFETGDFTGWSATYTGSSPYVSWMVSPAGFTDSFFTSSPNTGTYDALNGFDGDGPASYLLYQDVVATDSVGNLEFAYRAQWDMTFGATLDRTISVEVTDLDTATIVESRLLLTAQANTTNYGGPWIYDNMTSFAAVPGHTYRIQFEAYIPQAFRGPGMLEFDDIAITFTAGGGNLNVPHITDVKINAGANVPAYADPGGEQVRLANGQHLFLPQDSGNDGADTYIVTDTMVIDGVTWYSIFIGNENFVWVSGPQVIPLGQ